MWPHSHKFQPQGPTEYDRGENLRGWLLVEAGYSETLEYDAETETGSTCSYFEYIYNNLMGIREKET